MKSRTAVAVFGWGCCVAAGWVCAENPAPRAWTTLTLLPSASTGLILDGPDARVQVLVTAGDADGREQDVTRQVAISIDPPGVLQVDETGFASPLADGTATLTARLGNLSAQITATVSHVHDARPIHFGNQIVPIFTKLGCNGGGCHGKASGQNGFRLSLLGFYPSDDYEFLVKESRGRRIFPPAPDKSLLLTKPSGELPHGGGKRFAKDSHEYQLLRRWIEQGMPRGEESAPGVVRIECLPAARVLPPQGTQQIAVQAVYSDGRREDVTRMALFESNDVELGEVSPAGLVAAHELSGEAAVMARYQGQAAVFRATIPLGAPATNFPPARNLIDEAVFAKLRLLGIPPSPLCDDATFLRRVSLDIAGRLPLEPEVRAFLADTSPDKRDRLINALIDSPEYADYFANKWSMVLRNKKRQDVDKEGAYAFHQWIWDALYDNKPYDQFVRDIISATGDPLSNPPSAWYREVSEIDDQVEDSAQLFLGLRIQCARCHHHPYERWSQDDYYGLAAFFSRVGRKDPAVDAPRNSRDRRVFHDEGVAQAANPRTGQAMKPAGLGSPPENIPPQRDPRISLADWMRAPDNPFFAKALVNRYWKHFFNRGIVEPEDDMRETNPPSNPELLDRLAAQFAASGYDLQELVRLICRSSVYQLSSLPNDYNLRDKQNFSRYYPKRLTAESLYDAFHQATGVEANFPGLPPGSRAVQLPDASMGPYFLKVFGQPQADTACECERSQAANLAQSLHLLNSQEVQGKIASETGRAHKLAAQTDRPHAERIRELYRWVYAREPEDSELQAALTHLDKHTQDVPAAYEDLVWALINTKEFLFNH